MAEEERKAKEERDRIQQKRDLARKQLQAKQKKWAEESKARELERERVLAAVQEEHSVSDDDREQPLLPDSDEAISLKEQTNEAEKRRTDFSGYVSP